MFVLIRAESEHPASVGILKEREVRKMARTILALMIAVVLCIGVAGVSHATTYSGALQYAPPLDAGDGLIVAPEGKTWPGYTESIAWTITNENAITGFPWQYTYTWQHGGTQSGLSHLIIEVSSGFAAADMSGLTGSSVVSIGEQKVSSGNPGMPADMDNGIRFGPLTPSPFNMTWSFWSNRAPVWGDFYARDGGANYSWNAGFLNEDPAGSPSNGTIGNKILRPDGAVVPEPSSLIALLGGLGACGSLVIRKRK